MLAEMAAWSDMQEASRETFPALTCLLLGWIRTASARHQAKKQGSLVSCSSSDNQSSKERNWEMDSMFPLHLLLWLQQWLIKLVYIQREKLPLEKEKHDRTINLISCSINLDFSYSIEWHLYTCLTFAEEGDSNWKNTKIFFSCWKVTEFTQFLECHMVTCTVN